MTDKELILDTLTYLKNKGSHIIISDHWNSLDDDTKERLKLKLEDNRFITVHPYDIWSFMITTPGIKILKNTDELDEDGNINSAYVIQEQENEIIKLQTENLKLQNKDLKRKLPLGIITFMAGAILSAVLLLAQSRLEEAKQPTEQIIKVQVVIPHMGPDTILVTKKIPIQ